MLSERGQASVEVLVLLAGAVFVAIAVGLYLKGVAGNISEKASEVSEGVSTE